MRPWPDRVTFKIVENDRWSVRKVWFNSSSSLIQKIDMFYADWKCLHWKFIEPLVQVRIKVKGDWPFRTDKERIRLVSTGTLFCNINWIWKRSDNLKKISSLNFIIKFLIFTDFYVHRRSYVHQLGTDHIYNNLILLHN